MTEEPSIEERIGSGRFCITPHVAGLGDAYVFRLVPGERSHYYLLLEVLPPAPSIFDQEIEPCLPRISRLRLPRHLIKEYVAESPYERGGNFDGTLVLHAEECAATADGDIAKVR